MKTNIPFYSFFVCLIFQVHAQTTTLIFKDHSGSIQPTQEQIAKEKNIVKQTLLETITQSGDKVVISYLYRNTNAISNKKELVFTPPAPPKKDMTSLEKTRYQASFTQAKFRYINHVEKALETDQPKSDQTRILEALPKIASHLEQKNVVRVLMLSDMLESSDRCELSRALHSKQDAEKKAKKHVLQIMTDFDLQASNHPTLQIDCYLPVEIMESGQVFQLLPYYWAEVFRYLFGTEQLKFHTL